LLIDHPGNPERRKAEKWPENTNMTISDAINASFRRMKYLLWDEGNVRRWLSLGFLGGLAGMSPSLNLNIPDKFPDTPGGIGAVLAVVAVVFVLSIILGWMACVARFSFLENVIYNRHAVLEPSSRLKGLGTRVFGFYASIFLAIFVTFFGGALAVGVGASAMPSPSGGAAAAMILGGLGLFLAVLIPLMLAMTVLFAVTDDLVIPIMYRDNCGVLAGFKKFFGLAKSNIGNLILWFLCRMVFLAMLGMIQLIAYCLVGAVSGMAVGAIAVPVYMLAHLDIQQTPGMLLAGTSAIAWLALAFLPCVMLSSPSATFGKCFSMYCLEMFDSSIVLLPSSGLGTVLDPVQESENPGLNPS
jgi:hypothetical protein